MIESVISGSKSSEMPTVPVSNSVPPVVTSPVNRFSRPKTRGKLAYFYCFIVLFSYISYMFLLMTLKKNTFKNNLAFQ